MTYHIKHAGHLKKVSSSRRVSAESSAPASQSFKVHEPHSLCRHHAQDEGGSLKLKKKLKGSIVRVMGPQQIYCYNVFKDYHLKHAGHLMLVSSSRRFPATSAAPAPYFLGSLNLTPWVDSMLIKGEGRSLKLKKKAQRIYCKSNGPASKYTVNAFLKITIWSMPVIWNRFPTVEELQQNQQYQLRSCSWSRNLTPYVDSMLKGEGVV